MFKNRRLRGVLSMLCALSLLLTVFAGGANAFAAGDAGATEEAAIEQKDGMEADSEVPDSEALSVEEQEDHILLFETKATRSATSNDLADFLTGVTINAPVDENGNYIVNPNGTYEMTLKFSENEGIQFDDEGVLTYSFPEGVIINDIGATAFSITVVDENGTAIVHDNLFEVVGGQLRIRFNQDDPEFERLKAMPNVSFSITFASSFDGNAGEIVFNENIVKDFVYEETADLTIYKNVVYDMESDTAYYELQIRSDGQNENVVIEDRLTGTALIFNKNVSVQSSVNGMLSVTPDYAAVDNGFRVTIPHTVHGEIITVRYSASVDNTKITSNGTVEQTNNTARVTSDQLPEGKEASADFAGQAKFQKVTKNAAGEPVPVGDGLYEQTWTILVNEDHKLPMGGTYIYDWITQNSRPFMLFNGDGITVNVSFENGGTETRVVPWSDLYLYSNSNGTYGWRYLAPEADGNASYEITCTTLINTAGALGDLTLANGAQINNGYDEGTTTVGVIGESVFNIRKDAVGTTAEESEWKITVTVPGSGLSEMHVTDDAPKLTYEGQDYVDYFQEGSFEVEGLLEGESWKLYIGGSQRSYTLTFYRSETQTDANKGLLPTPDGQPRDIVIRFKTDVNQDWLNLAAEDGYSSSTLSSHRNYAAAWSGSYRTQTVNATVVPIRPNLVKRFVERTDVEMDGVTYPVFRYSLDLLGPTADGITIHDAFNTEYLKFHDAAGIQIMGGMNANPTNGNGMISAVNTAEGMDIIVSRFPRQDDGSFYPYYKVSYSLIVKDQDALLALNAAAAESQNGIDLENTAAWEGRESSRVVNYTYFPYVDKELLTRPTADNGYVAEFSVIINQYAEDLDPTSDVLAIQDVLSSNLRFIPDSLTIVPANDSIAVQHDDETNTLIFTEVPDNTTFTITYQARVLGSGNVTYSNTIKFGNFEKIVEETAVVESSGGGTASNPSITIVKRDSENLSATLAGAVFQLFYIENGDPIPVRDRNGQDVTFSTEADGKVLVVGNLQALGWTLWADRTYCLVETEAPAGYELNTEPTYFVLTEHPSSQMEFDITGDQLSVKNEPVKISVPVTKTWIGPAGTGPVVVHLLADGIDTGKTAALTADNRWTGVFENLRKYDDTGSEISYSVEEDPIQNYEPQYAGSAEDGFVITNTNTETIDIPVVKQWVGPIAEEEFILQAVRRSAARGNTMPVMLVIELLADGIPADVLYLSPVNDYSGVFEGLPKYSAGDGHEIVYTIREVNVPDGYEAEITENADGGFVITNTNIENIEIPVIKQWVGPAAESVTLRLLADGAEASSVDLTVENGWQHTFAGLPKYDHTDGHEIIYDVQEAPVPGYTQGRSGSAKTGFTFTNTITGKVSVPVTKAWVGPAAESVTVELLADGVKTAEAVLNEENGWQHTFVDLDQYSSGAEIIYTIREVGINGYATEITGDQSGFVITNTNTETIDIPVIKQWVGPAAESVTLRLLADGAEASSAVLTEENGWQHTFAGLPKYDHTDGHEIIYDVQEAPVPGYTQGRSGSAETGFTFTNTITGKVSVPVTKAWIGPAAESVTVELLADGVKTAEAVLNEENGWQHTFVDLDQYSSGAEIIYTIREVNVPDGYEAEITENADGGFVITNTNIETIEIPVIKQWVGPAAESVTLRLLADGAEASSVDLTEENGWKHTFAGLPKYDHTDGHEIIYDVQEAPVPGYTQGRSGSPETGFTFTNTITGKVSVPVTKAWIGPAAQSVTVELLADGVKTAETVLNEENAWQYTFIDLDQYSNGTEIIYTIREVGINGYSGKVAGNMNDGFIITNTNTETIDIPVEKRWVGPAAESVTIRLYADGTKIADVVLKQGDHWRHVFTRLPKYDSKDGHEIVYTITEDTVNGYTGSITGDVKSGFVVTNKKNTTPPHTTDTPKTGDESQLLLWFLVTILSGAAMIGVLLFKRKRTKHQKR